jgi:diadenosine tetraphosphate (Ap4A) HIT family hydrolase
MSILVNIKNSEGRAEYTKLLENSVQKGECPLCFEVLLRIKKEILHEIDGWILVPNAYPYAGTEKHLLILPKEHIDNLEVLTTTDLKAIHQLFLWAQERYHFPGGAFTMRFGDLAYSGATIRHVHCHIIVPAKDNTSGIISKVVFPIAH